MAEAVFSVSQINEYLSRKLWRDPFLGRLSVVGEVTNFGVSSTGHAFFSLKDEDSLLNCIRHDFLGGESDGLIEDGALVKATGRITYYRKSGSVQFVVEKISLQGAGDLFARFEQTKKKLAEEGIFSLTHKRPLPEFPLSLGVVTSPAGAVLHDIIVVATRRFEGIRITVYPVQVQGSSAAREICEGIGYFSEKGGVDVIIVGRGGGSFEDLSAFNEECVARAVYASKIPVVSAVGHETDYSLCDMASDLRAPTPSAAAEIVVPDKSVLVRYLSESRDDLRQSVISILDDYRMRAQSLKQSVKAFPFDIMLGQADERIMAKKAVMKGALSALAQRHFLTLERYRSSLDSLDPRSVLKRGYAIVYDDKGKVITSKDNAVPDMEIEFADGRIAVEGKGLPNG